MRGRNGNALLAELEIAQLDAELLTVVALLVSGLVKPVSGEKVSITEERRGEKGKRT
jgi:hypothetical protein